MHGVVAAVVVAVVAGGNYKNSTVWVAQSLGPDLALGEVEGNDEIGTAVGTAAASVGLGSHRKEQYSSQDRIWTRR
jgi:hypothetical protein